MRKLGYTYADIGAEIIDHWGIPKSISTPIRNQNVDVTPPSSKDDEVLQLSTLLALENIYAELYQANSKLTPEMYESLGFEKIDIDNALDYTNLNIMSVVQMFSPSAFAVF